MDKALEARIAKGMNRRIIAIELSRQFDVKLTKNSIIGRANRIGAVCLVPRDFSQPVAPPKEHRAPPRAKPVTAAIPKPVYIRKAEEGGCQFLFGEAAERNFCDKPRVRTKKHSSGMWCREHEHVVYNVTPRPRVPQ